MPGIAASNTSASPDGSITATVAIEAAAVSRERGGEPRSLLCIGKPDALGKLGQIVVRNHQLVLSARRVLFCSTTAIGKPAVPGGSPVQINRAGDAKAQQYPLNYRKVIVVALRKTDAHSLLLISLDAAIGIEQTAQEAGA